ncbi:unnamed protein product [Adineta ricciae]|uniref:Uncharacterized protein n=1 Tax=Adineta ricciae TaxID=249248 RepID=A0A814AS19_ADIRI|nr:unnamed protein product [Adineta ricciae]
MSDTLVLTSINGCLLSNKLVDSWLDANEIYIARKILSADRRSVEITFVDDERTEMMFDLLTTCYSNFVSITRAQPLNNSSEDERVPSPAHLSSSVSVASKMSAFSQRLAAIDKKQNEDTFQSAIGRGRGFDHNSAQMQHLTTKNGSDDSDIYSNLHHPPSSCTTQRQFGTFYLNVFGTILLIIIIPWEKELGTDRTHQSSNS